MGIKISVCGKGGSGKSTLVGLLAIAAQARGLMTLVVDSDESNSGLFRMLGLDKPPTPLMALVGGKEGIKEKMNQPSLLSESELTLEQIPYPYVNQKNGLRLLSIGKIHQALEGCACPMGALSREFLKKLHLSANEIVIVDMEAGIEHFGRGVEISIDAVIAVIEPSLESINLAEKISSLTSGAGANFAGVVVNKVSSDSMYEKIKGELEKRRLPILGKIPFSEGIVEACLQGQPVDLAESRGEVMKIIEKLQAALGLEEIKIEK